MFKNPFSFNGRIRRTEYGISFIIAIFVWMIFGAIGRFMNEQIGGLIDFILLIPLIWFTWAQGAKRCHDMGNSGWWQLVPFYFVVLIVQEGYPEMNKYGVNPKIK